MFVDTSAWYAAYVPTDAAHQRVQAFLSPSQQIVTSDYVIDETLTLLRARGHNRRALMFGEHMFRQDVVKILMASEQDLANAWIIFSTMADKSWSFTDCTSFAIMRRLGIVRVLTLDVHFRQMAGIEAIGA